MRNLKRALSFALASVMVIGLMVVGAGAAYKDFTDTDEIQNKEAVQTLVSLNVIAGKEDGSYYDPTGTLTRAEMAKLVTYVMNGGTEPVLSTKPVPTYSDIDNHWAEKYIEYCTSQGIIAGDGAGKFNPEGTLTGSQAAKMILVAMGYSSNVFGFTGNAWEINTNREANDAKLYDGLSGMDPSQPISRDNAAQLVYNAIQAPLMKRTWSQDMTTGAITEVYTPAVDDEGKTVNSLFIDKFGGKIFVGDFRGNYDTGAAAAKGEVEIYGRLDTDDGTSAGQTDRAADFPADLELSGLGEEYKVLFKDGKGGIDNRPDKYDTIYGVYKTGTTVVYNITKSALQDAGTDNLNDGKVKFGDTLYTMANSLTVVENYGAATTTISGKVNAANYLNDNTAGIGNGRRVNSTDSVKLVCNDDGEIYYAYIMNTNTSKVTALTDTNIQLAGQTSKKVEDCQGFDDVAVGDEVRFANVYPTATRKTLFVEKAEVIEGEIQAFNATGSAVQIADTWYKYNGHNSFVDSDYTSAALTSTNVGDTVSLIMDGGEFYGAYKVISGYNDYAVVTWQGTNLGTNSVRALLADGTTAAYEFSKTDDVSGSYDGVEFSDLSAVSSADANTARLYAYDLESNNSKIKLSTPNSSSASYGSHNNGGSYTASNMTLSLTGGSSFIVSPDASVFLYGGTPDAKWKTYTASQLASFNLNSVGSSSYDIEYIIRDGKVVAFKGYVTNLPTAGSNSVGYGYVTNRVVTKVNDSNVIQLTIWDGTDSITLNVDGTTTTANKGDFIQYPLVADGAIVGSNDVYVETGNGLNWNAAKIKTYDTTNNLLITTTDTIGVGGAVVTGTDYSYKLTADTKIIGVNTADRAGSTVNSPIKYTETVGSDFNNAYVIAESKTDNSVTYYEVLAIFIDEDNKLVEYTNGATPGTAGGNATTYAMGNASNTKNGVTVTLTPSKSTALNTEVITYTLTVTGTSTGTPTFTIGGVTTGLGSVSGTNCNITSGTTISIPATGAVSGTWTFSVTCSAAAVTPTIS